MLDLHTRRASVGERAVELTAREHGLPEGFLRHPDQVLSREQRLSHVCVRYLRRLGSEVIETKRGMGERLSVRPDEQRTG